MTHAGHWKLIAVVLLCVRIHDLFEVVVEPLAEWHVVANTALLCLTARLHPLRIVINTGAVRRDEVGVDIVEVVTCVVAGVFCC